MNKLTIFTKNLLLQLDQNKINLNLINIKEFLWFVINRIYIILGI